MVNEITYKVGGGIGDVLHQTAILKAIKKKYPTSKIYVYLETAPNRKKPIYDLHKYNPYIEQFIDDIKGKVINVKENKQSGKSNIPISLCNSFGFDKKDIECPIFLSEDEKQWAKDKLSNLGLNPDKLVGIGERVRPKKIWHGYKELIERLHKSGYSVIQLGTHKPPEDETVPTILARDLDMDIRKTVAIMSQCKSFVSIGSGLGIIAYWLDIPLIALWGGAGKPFWFTDQDYKLNKVKMLEGPCDLYCGGEHSPCKKGFTSNWPCMKVSVRRVFNSIKEVVK